ncbi:hypothetical protein K490DRAFT_55296 [Saccharata proteae CBS 121410]|uniref:Mediator of RNA polymerase II transcription subunit 21 n=1 Tax=Saccharata proteae CBS 121410 TaxID=1314787 RepID=A0A6A5YFL8_9PEZI|nr:hypothetical protein K490DRAFT_55296 [Saccharata proteae CBS 121410]
MTDMLTQLQDALDVLLQQFYAGLAYTTTRHPYGTIAGQTHNPAADPSTTNTTATSPTQTQHPSTAADPSNPPQPPRSPPPDPDFTATQHEISEDIVMNIARIEALIQRLPGIGQSEKAQLARMEELNRLLEEEEGRRVEAVREKERLLQVLDERIMRVRRP